MATRAKDIYIDTIHLGYANKAEVSPDISHAEPTPTFDGPVPNGSDTVTWNVSIDKLRYGKIEDYKAIETLLLSMIKTPKKITIIERKDSIDGQLRVTTAVYKCVLSDKKYTMDMENNTVENLSFTGTSMKEWVNGEEIKY